MPEMVGYFLLFTAVGVAFILVNLTVGKLVRPAKMDAEKATIYECGEPTIGSAWVQFDLRFYVVALLFVIFDVEMAFFFPWAVVFGKANQLADPRLPEDQRAALTAEMTRFAPGDPHQQWERQKARYEARLAEPGVDEETRAAWQKDLEAHLAREPKAAAAAPPADPGAARTLALVAFVDILVFFGVLLVGYAYLWRRGDLDWVRSLAAQRAELAAAAQDRRRELLMVTKD
jgi:NADH-quinone oxidoreductase subunit A